MEKFWNPNDLKGVTVPRLPVRPSGQLGLEIAAAMRARSMSPQQLAAAARVHKGTVYKILSGKTESPHYSTLRRLCKILELDIARLIGSEQLDLIEGKLEERGALDALADLLIGEINAFPSVERGDAAFVCAVALLEVKLGVGRGAEPTYVDEIRKSDPDNVATVVVRQLTALEAVVRPEATRQALGALLDFRIIRTSNPPSRHTIAAIDYLRNRHWRPVEPRKVRRLRSVV